MLESSIQRKIIQRIRAAGAFVRKIESPGNAGMPDLMVLYRSQVLFLELKTDTGRLSPLQVLTHTQIRAAGVRVETSFGLDDAERIVDQFLASCK